MEVAKGIHRIETSFGDRVNAAYLLVGSRTSLLVDTTIRDTAHEIADYMRGLGLEPAALRYVVSTHSDWDHIGGNAETREFAPNAMFCCHELDRPMIEDVESMIANRYGEFATDHGHDETDEFKQAVRDGTGTVQIDIGLTGGEVLDLGDGWRVELLHTPGHSWGSLSVYDSRSRAAIVGDAVLGDAVMTKSGDAAFPPTYRYVDTYLATTHHLQHLAPSLLLTSHYPVLADASAREFLAASRGFVERTEGALRAALQRTPPPIRMMELARALSPALGAWPDTAAPALLFPFSGHLERLVQHGLVDAARDSESSLLTYSWRG